MTTEKYRKYACMTLTFAGAFAALYLFCRYALRALLPFLLSGGLVVLLLPAAAFFRKKIGGSERVWRMVLSLLSLLLFTSLLYVLGRVLYREAIRFLGSFSDREKLDAVFGFFCHPFGNTGAEDGGWGELLTRLEEGIADASTQLLSRATLYVTDLAGQIPRLLLFFPVLFLATGYFAWDYEKIKEKLLSLLPEKWKSPLAAVRRNVLGTLFPYVFAYLKLMLLTFAFTAIGLSVLKVGSPLFLALVIAILDLLPVIGVGTVLIPWGIYEIFLGNRALGIGLLVLYVLHEIMRQFAEPKIVGRELGVHPLLSLVFLYVGYSLFGITGLLLLPVFSVLTKTLVRGKKPKDA